MRDQSVDIRAYARAGAQARLAQLGEEVEEIRRLFPELRARAGEVLSGRFAGVSGPAAARRTGTARQSRPRTISVEGRKRISDAQKARWAARRAAAASSSSDAAAKRTSKAQRKR